jgi:hypothetical protein
MATAQSGRGQLARGRELVNIMADWKESKRIHDEAKRVERDAAELSQRLGISDALTQWRNDAAARAAAEREETRRRRIAERREQRERVESATVTELSAEIEALRELIAKGDVEMLSVVETAIIPMVEKVGDGLQRQIREIGARVDRQLAEMQAEVRASIKHERGEVLDLPSWREARKVN